MSDPFAPPPQDGPGGFAPPPPPGDFSQPAYPGHEPQAAYQPGFQPPTQPVSTGSGKKTLLIVVVAVLLLCCCGAVGTGVWFFRSGTLDDVLDSGQGVQGTGGQGVTAWLSWNGAVDIDLEVYDALGTSFIGSAYSWTGNDVTDGSQGDEYLEFKSFPDQDFSTGQYTLVAYYFGADDSSYPDTTVELTVQDANGGVQTFTKTIQYDSSNDQWFALRIDGATGAVTMVDTVE